VAEKLMKKMQGQATTDERKMKQHDHGIESKKRALEVTLKACTGAPTTLATVVSTVAYYFCCLAIEGDPENDPFEIDKY
jgi:hypothetical protein